MKHLGKLLFQKNGQVELPTLVLQSKAGISYGALMGASDITYRKNLNSANELSFAVSKYLNGKLNPLWEQITDLKTIYIPEYQEKFEIKVLYKDSGQETKSITATSLCEAELGQIMLRGLEINTEQDLKTNITENYPVTVFYLDISDLDAENTRTEKKKHSLLHRVLAEKAPHYTIGHVDTSLKSLSFEFTASNTSIYDFLTGEVAEKMQCLFFFDSIHRKIHAYDLCSTCNVCYEELLGTSISKRKHFRSDFHDKCPKCLSTNITEGYGHDTTILIDRENIASSLSIEGNIDSLKNCFYVEGGDETINAAFIQLNPAGSPYIYYFSPETLADMPKDLQKALQDYGKKYEEYSSNHVIDTTTTTHTYKTTNQVPYMAPAAFNSTKKDSNYVSGINTVLTEISQLSKKKPYTTYNYQIPTVFSGQSHLVKYYYNALDLQSFLEISMMPTYEMKTYDKYNALSLLNSTAFGTVAVSGLNNSNTIKSSIENVILNKAKTLINTALFSVALAESSSTVSLKSQTDGKKIYEGKWEGTFSVTDRQNSDDATNTITNSNYSAIAKKEGITVSVNIPSQVSILLNDDVITYAKDSISYMVSSKKLPIATDLYSLDTSVDKFQKEAKLHSKNNLFTFQNVLNDCLGILTGQIDTIKEKSGNLYQEMLEYQNNYKEKLAIISNLLSTREQQLNKVTKFLLLLQAYMKEIKEKLDFQKFLETYKTTDNLTENLWKIFQYYRREGEYKNEHIISDNLKSNEKVIAHAKWLMEDAQKELLKAGTIQYNISTSLSNLLALPEFKPILQDFDVGNWIRVRMDDQIGKEDTIYKLRLLSYQINFEAASSDIDVEFSTVIHTANNTMSDAKSILKSAQTMAKSYNAVTKQMALNTETVKKVNHWVSDGLDMTNQKICNNAQRQTLIIDNQGLLAMKYDDLKNTYDDCQLKLLNNGIYTTHDNWHTLDAALGKFIYKDPSKNWKETETYGIIAKKLIGEQILGEDLRISNPSGSLQFNSQGLAVTNGINTITINPNNKQKLFLITAQNGDSSTEVFCTDSKGNITAFNGTFSGTIHATGGTFSGNITSTGTIKGGTIKGANLDSAKGSIGGWTIGEQSLYYKASSLKNTTLGGIYLGTDGLRFNCSETDKAEYITFKDGSFRSYGTYGYTEICSGIIDTYINDAGMQAGYYVTNKKSGMCISVTDDGICYARKETDNTFDTYFSLDETGIFYAKSSSEYYLAPDGDIYARNLITSEGKFYVYDNSTDQRHKILFYDSINQKILLGNENLNSYLLLKGNKSHFIEYRNNYFKCTDNNIASLGESDSLWTQLYAKKDSITTSDRTKKKNIHYLNEESSEKYLALFMKLMPCQYMFQDGDRVHIGAIAQDIEIAMEECGIDIMEFGALCKDEIYEYEKDEDGINIDSTKRLVKDETGTIVYHYSLRYSEFIMLTIYMVQKTVKRVDKLEQELLNTQKKLQELLNTQKQLQELLNTQKQLQELLNTQKQLQE